MEITIVIWKTVKGELAALCLLFGKKQEHGRNKNVAQSM